MSKAVIETVAVLAMIASMLVIVDIAWGEYVHAGVWVWAR